MKITPLHGLLLAISHTFQKSVAQIEPKIVGGEFANIQNYPHSVFLSVLQCSNDNSPVSWICGGSILNQNFVLTAAHCLDECHRGSKIYVVYGHENKNMGNGRRSHKFKIHENFNTHTLQADIAIIKVQNDIVFSKKVQRVMIHWDTPTAGSAYVAGWGVVEQKTGATATSLKYIKQNILPRVECSNILGSLPPGRLCAGQTKVGQFAAEGDSGGALVVRNYFQIGIVSYKIPTISISLIVYTDVGYYYNWITKNTKQLFCS
ncbi:hypothetical protein ACJJTC_012070 [Scirpophaga incertulas]